MTEKTKCPCCGNSFEIDSEQAICVESFGECIFCRFSPNSKGSKSGTQAELSEIVVKQEVKRRFKNQQPKTIDMEAFVGSGKPVVPPFKPDWNTQAVLVKDAIQRMTAELKESNEKIKKLEKIIADQESIMTAQAMRIVDLQTHIKNLEGEE